MLKDITFRLQTKPTIFYIVAPLVILFSIPMFFYTIQLQGGESMYGFFYLFFIFISTFALLIDYILVRYINYKIASIIEVIISLILYIALTAIQN